MTWIDVAFCALLWCGMWGASGVTGIVIGNRIEHDNDDFEVLVWASEDGETEDERREIIRWHRNVYNDDGTSAMWFGLGCLVIGVFPVWLAAVEVGIKLLWGGS
jgi:hypothetical protein